MCQFILRMVRNRYSFMPFMAGFMFFYLMNYFFKIHETTNQQTNNFIRSNQRYPRRDNFAACSHPYGRVKVIVIYVESSYKRFYRVAQESLKCYLKSTDYELLLVDLDNDRRVNALCRNNQLFFKKHCAVLAYMNETDWMLVLDADTGVVNPNHCIEEWIDPRVDIVLYERFFNWEIASGNYLIKNTEFARNFLRIWADWEFIQPASWNGADNGVLQIHVLKTVQPEAIQEVENCRKIWSNGTNYETYLAYVTCVKIYLGLQRIWPGKLRIFKRAHGFVRDGFLTDDSWCSNDFMIHGWKHQTIEQDGWQSPFKMIPNSSKCGAHYAEWHWRSNKKIDCKGVLKGLAALETRLALEYPKEARVIPYLLLPDIGNCYPNCEVVQ